MNNLFTVSDAEQPEPLRFDPMDDCRSPLLWAIGDHMSSYEPLAGWQCAADDINICVA